MLRFSRARCFITGLVLCVFPRPRENRRSEPPRLAQGPGKGESVPMSVIIIKGDTRKVVAVTDPLTGTEVVIDWWVPVDPIVGLPSVSLLRKPGLRRYDYNPRLPSWKREVEIHHCLGNEDD